MNRNEKLGESLWDRTTKEGIVTATQAEGTRESHCSPSTTFTWSSHTFSCYWHIKLIHNTISRKGSVLMLPLVCCGRMMHGWCCYRVHLLERLGGVFCDSELIIWPWQASCFKSIWASSWGASPELLEYRKQDKYTYTEFPRNKEALFEWWCASKEVVKDFGSFTNSC